MTVSEGYEPEDIFDTDDGDFNEPPLKTEEVEINFERNGKRKEPGV
jgi:hypothetical protein